MIDVNNANSALKLERLYFDKILFDREKIQEGSSETEVEVAVSEPKKNGESFSMHILIKIEGKEGYTLAVELCGEFLIAGGLREENEYMAKNAVAIMFPYMRSEITLLTSQPDIQPVILPPLNINTLMDKNRND